MIKPSETKVFVHPSWGGASTRLFAGRGFQIVHSPEECDIIVFNGGEDINPKLYDQEPISGAGVYFDQSRDDSELEAYKRAPNAFKFGICRGGQLLNVLNGGKLWQDVDNHGHAHDMVDALSGETIFTSSVHHQMMIPAKGAELVAFAAESNYKLGLFSGRKAMWQRGSAPLTDKFHRDPEVIWYAKDRALCIQGHPEYGGYSQMTDYCFKLIERYYG